MKYNLRYDKIFSYIYIIYDTFCNIYIYIILSNIIQIPILRTIYVTTNTYKYQHCLLGHSITHISICHSMSDNLSWETSLKAKNIGIS